ncbi:MAG TPA: M20/M25/M40 family metallo-hydrolase, partial [Patescibacteria group bacterium]
GFEIIISEDEPAQFSEKEDKSVKALASSIKNKTGKETDFILKHGASDIRHFNVFGFPGVVFGPIGEGLHSDNEWVNIESLTTYFEILEDFILSLNEK